MNTYHDNTARMSPTLNGSYALERFERGNAIKIRNGMMFDFYLGLKHTIVIPGWTVLMSSIPMNTLVINFKCKLLVIIILIIKVLPLSTGYPIMPKNPQESQRINLLTVLSFTC